MRNLKFPEYDAQGLATACSRIVWLITTLARANEWGKNKHPLTSVRMNQVSTLTRLNGYLVGGWMDELSEKRSHSREAEKSSIDSFLSYIMF